VLQVVAQDSQQQEQPKPAEEHLPHVSEGSDVVIAGIDLGSEPHITAPAFDPSGVDSTRGRSSPFTSQVA
jgi:hypothetical protein